MRDEELKDTKQAALASDSAAMFFFAPPCPSIRFVRRLDGLHSRMGGGTIVRGRDSHGEVRRVDTRLLCMVYTTHVYLVLVRIKKCRDAINDVSRE